MKQHPRYETEELVIIIRENTDLHIVKYLKNFFKNIKNIL